MRLLVLFCFLPLVLGGAIPGQEKCVWGPPYWCSHVTHARECGATTHCLQTVWKNQIIKPKSTTTCTYCELIVNEFRDALQDKTTEDDIANILTNVCAILPGDYLDMCKGIITDYAPELLEMFAKDISTDMICATIGLCSGLEDTWSPYGVKANNETVCADCTKFFKDVQESITSNETVNQLTQLINQTVCSLLGGFSELCMDFVEQYLPSGLQMLADQIDPDIVCRVFGFCSAEGPNAEVLKIKNIFQGRQSVGPLEYRSSEECDLCKDFFNQIVAMIKDKDNQDKVIAELKTVVCDELGTFADQCKELVDEYAPMLFELLVNELDPTTLCEAVGVCQTPSLSQEILKAEEQPASMVGPGYVKTSVECDACKILMSEIDSFIKENGTVKKFEDLIDKVCEKLPSDDLKKQCLAFVKEYGPLVVNLTAQELDPKVFCGKIGLCNDTVKETKVADSTCDMCTLFVNGIKSALENVSSQVLMNDLKSICALVPGNYSTLCLKYVNTYAPLVIDLLKTTDAKKICEMATLCTSSLTPYMTKPIPEKIVSSGPSIECEVCGTVIIAVKKLLSSNASEADVKAALEKVCSVIPSVLQSECDDLVKKYGDQLIQMLVKDLDANTICKELGLCKEASRKQESAIMSAIMSPYNTLPLFVPVENKKAPGGPSEACEICDTVIIFLKEYLSNKDTEGEVKQLLKDLCAYLPSTITSTCETLVDNYGDNFIQVLLKYLDANTICSDLGLCEALEKSSTSVSTALMSPYDILHSFKPLENKKGDEGGSEECVVCKSVMNFLDKELQQNRTKELIKAALDDVCSELGDLKTECTELVDTYSDVIINYLILSESPDMICKTIGLCSARTENLPKPVHVKLLKDNSETVPVKAGILCDVCQLAMKEVDNILMENRSQAAIEAALDKVCSLLPETLRNECDDFVKQYGPAIIQLIVNNADPNEVCSKLGLCAQRHSEIKEDTKPVKAGALCEICKLVIEEVDKLLKGNRSEDAIRKALDEVCSVLPNTISTECTEIVNKYTKMIVNLLVNNIEPAEICKILTLCAAKQSQPFGAFVKILTEMPKDGMDECVLCEVIVNVVQLELKENSTKQSIDQYMESFCSYLPDTVSDQCDVFVDKYVDEAIEKFAQGYTPQQICQDLKKCSKFDDKTDDDTLYFKPHHKLVGGKKCTYGPAYWCASKENAAECHAVEHCTRHVWN